MLSQNKGYFWNLFFFFLSCKNLNSHWNFSNTYLKIWGGDEQKGPIKLFIFCYYCCFSLYIFEWLMHGMSIVSSMDRAGIYLVFCCTVGMLLILMTANWSFDPVIDRLWFLWWCVLSVYASLNIFNMCIQWWLYFIEIFIQFCKSRK